MVTSPRRHAKNRNARLGDRGEMHLQSNTQRDQLLCRAGNRQVNDPENEIQSRSYVLAEVFQRCTIGKSFTLHHRLTGTLFSGSFERWSTRKVTHKDMSLATVSSAGLKAYQCV